jgi:hypothetical protein
MDKNCGIQPITGQAFSAAIFLGTSAFGKATVFEPFGCRNTRMWSVGVCNKGGGQRLNRNAEG